MQQAQFSPAHAITITKIVTCTRMRTSVRGDAARGSVLLYMYVIRTYSAHITAIGMRKRSTPDISLTIIRHTSDVRPNDEYLFNIVHIVFMQMQIHV